MDFDSIAEQRVTGYRQLYIRFFLSRGIWYRHPGKLHFVGA